MLHFLAAGGKFRLRTAVDDIHDVRSQPLCRAHRVHRDVAAAHDGDLLRVEDGGLAVRFIRLHEVAAGEVFVGGEDALCVLPGDVHEAGKARARAEEDGFEAELLFELVDGEHFADDHVRHHLDAERSEVIYLLFDDGFGKTEFGDAVDEHAARKVQRFEDGHVVAELGKIARAGEPRGTRADDGDLMPVGLRLCGSLSCVGVVPVGNEALEPADADGLALDAARALAFALRLLRAHPSADGGKGRGAGNDLIGLFEFALRDEGDKFGDGDVDGAARNAGLIFTI